MDISLGLQESNTLDDITATKSDPKLPDKNRRGSETPSAESRALAAKDASRGGNVTSETRQPRQRPSDRGSTKDIRHSRTSSEENEILHGVEGSLDRLERLSIMIRQSSKNSESRKVTEFEKEYDDSEFVLLLSVILNHWFPNTDKGLSECIKKSILYRRYRILYERKHQSRIHEEREPERTMPLESVAETSPLEVRPDTTPEYTVSLSKHPGAPRRLLQADVTDISKSGRSTLNRDIFQAKRDEPSPPASEASGSSAAWAGDIDYPEPPKPKLGMSYVECQICLKRYEKTKFNRKRSWRYI